MSLGDSNCDVCGDPIPEDEWGRLGGPDGVYCQECYDEALSKDADGDAETEECIDSDAETEECIDCGEQKPVEDGEYHFSEFYCSSCVQNFDIPW